MIANRINKTSTIANPLPHPHPVDLFSHIILHLLKLGYYNQAPSMIINRMNKTKTIAA